MYHLKYRVHFFFISLLQQLYKEEHIVKFKIPNL